MGYVSEEQLENKLIAKLESMDYDYVEIDTYDDLIANLKIQLEKLNSEKLESPLSDTEFKRVLNFLLGKTVFVSAKQLRDKFILERDNGEKVPIYFLDEISTKNIYQVTHQITVERKYTNRYDVTILVNGLPLVQIELKRAGIDINEAINQINRYIGVALAFIQGFAMAFTFVKDAGTLEYLKIAVILTAGTAFLLWLGDQITQKGIGNGISLLIMAGIIYTVPKMFIDTFTSLVLDRTGSLFVGIIGYFIFVLVYLLIIVGIVFEENSERRIPIQYSNRTNSAYGAKQNYIPFKLNSASVMPVIFASVILTIPTFISGLLGESSKFSVFVSKYINYTTPTGFVLYIILIFVFGFFYTNMQINPKELAKNLNKSGGYIPGIRPGTDTSSYLAKVINRLSFVGSILLVVIAILPILFSKFSGLSSAVTIGGTGLLIVVGVAIETNKQLDSSLISRSYKKGYRRR